ncbi:MAG: restriction endonuclease [Terriglobia bacterium]
MAMVVMTMPRPNQHPMRPKQAEFEALIANVFRRAGWNVVRQPPAQRVDLIADSGEKKYVIEVKQSSEGRRDRLIPLLSQSILQAQAFSEAITRIRGSSRDRRSRSDSRLGRRTA